MLGAEPVNAAETNQPVTMTRASLDHLPEFALPAGFAIRWYQPGDEAHWLRIHLAADRHNPITPELFQQQFAPEGSDLEGAVPALRERQCYLFDTRGEAIGTGTAWFNNHFAGGSWGRVHWLAVVPGFQGRGLGKALLSAVCQRLRELGLGRAYLSTSTARPAAIQWYRRWGFEPLIRNPAEERVWREFDSGA